MAILSNRAGGEGPNGGPWDSHVKSKILKSVRLWQTKTAHMHIG